MTREQLALAHHRFYCDHGASEDCTDVDDSDYDFADFALSQAREATS